MEANEMLWNKKQWISLCSKHQEYKMECELCNSGSYVNVWKLRLDNIIYKVLPNLWIKVKNMKL